MPHLDRLHIVNRFHALGSHFYTECRPRGLTNPRLVRSDPRAAGLLGLDPAALGSEACLQIFSGNRSLPGGRPLAQDYAGHQFGRFNPFLGDGRVLLLGGVEHDGDHWEISLKGAGKTPYGRQADGQAGLSECLREFECGVELAALGIPAAQGLCVIAGDERVYRHGFEPAAVLVRLAPSHIRFGTFENCYFQRNTEALRRLAEHTIDHHFPACREEEGYRYDCFFRDVVIATARLIARWQAAGFVHGMMNTDNMSILGITLDLGAAGFTPERNPDFVSSQDDEHGRYAFGRQPVVGLWNCNVLARALSPLIAAADLRAALREYEPEYLRCHESLTA